jgi:hypothetical protein
MMMSKDGGELWIREGREEIMRSRVEEDRSESREVQMVCLRCKMAAARIEFSPEESVEMERSAGMKSAEDRRRSSSISAEWTVSNCIVC